MEQFDLKKFLVENKLTTNSALLFEEQASFNYDDIKKKVAPALDKIISTATSKSKQVYDIVKKEFNEQNAEKGLEVAKNLYTKLKSLGDDATSDPKKLKAIGAFIPTIKNSVLGSAALGIYQYLSGMTPTYKDVKVLGYDTGMDWFTGYTQGDYTPALFIAGMLVSLKLLIFILHVIANKRKGKYPFKGTSLFGMKKLGIRENEEILNLDKSNFNDIKAIFS